MELLEPAPLRFHWPGGSRSQALLLKLVVLRYLVRFGYWRRPGLGQGNGFRSGSRFPLAGLDGRVRLDGGVCARQVRGSRAASARGVAAHGLLFLRCPRCCGRRLLGALVGNRLESQPLV